MVKFEPSVVQPYGSEFLLSLGVSKVFIGCVLRLRYPEGSNFTISYPPASNHSLPYGCTRGLSGGGGVDGPLACHNFVAL
jgi:hypothetical protein